ncbi:uncharacterized protein G2W53_041273 [Senna tora]|uniref:Uncharacterized protein n=1 Tax=Senna tora TaxID=362788 RepID=A0A834VYJ9_9FABA|nr:uncharacterized protein G2W53_041273 [Senna tora]
MANPSRSKTFSVATMAAMSRCPC